MAEADVDEADQPKTASKLPLILGVVVALLGGAGGFFFMYFEGLSQSVQKQSDPIPYLGTAHFLALDPITIPLGDGPTNRILRFQAHLEVEAETLSQIEAMRPRILDVLNTYLRSVDLETLQDRRALLLLRAQMLRRVQVVTDENVVRDLLITEFIVN